MRSKMIPLALALVAACKAAPTPAPEKTPAPAPVKTATVAAEPATPVEAWRSTPPAPGEEKKPVLPAFQTAKLKSGLTVMVPDQRSVVPIVSIELVSKGGAMLDGAAKAGLANLTFGMMSEGAGGRDALELSDAFADLGASFSAAADRDRGSVAIAGLARNADAMAAMLADVVLRPRFAQKDFDRRKSQILASLARSRGSPQGLAFEAIPALVYGKDHPYGHPPTGTPETVAKLTLGDVKGAWPKLATPQTSALIVSGALSLDDAVKLAEKHFGKWAQRAPKLPVATDVAPKTRADIVLIDKPGAAQTMVLVARPLFGRGHADEQAMTVANEIYGGAFTSRLNMNLREDKGYTYGAGSQVAFRQGVGVFLAYAAIRQDATAPGLAEFFRELDGLVKAPPTEDEVGHAKASIIRGLPGAFERTSALGGAGATIFVYGLPLDYFVGLPGRYERVTATDVRGMAEKYLGPATMQALLVGDAAAVEKPVGALGLGTVTVRPNPGAASGK
ncbi:insulinase family protein [Myxococcota bacterium]|nr:insulinase family protein [Myxococcota bacterium]